MLLHVDRWSLFVLKCFGSVSPPLSLTNNKQPLFELCLCLLSTVLICCNIRAPKEFRSTRGKWKFPHTLTRQAKTSSSSRRRWMDGNNLRRIYGDFLHVRYFTSTIKRLLLTSHMLQMMLRQYTVQYECYTWLQAAIKITDKATLS